ncbi:F-box protein CPR1-like [Argentina anserina]|uniref:F-box protein CPR1-like n=1 Tax=Argentina anserina TaxID=57926 RepID=UPI0021764CC2|nr:F-box protein CPR1-like [Potentilla anserina]
MWPEKGKRSTRIRRRSTVSCYFQHDCYFQPEIIFEILTRLPPESLVKFMCVCKDWNSIIRSQKFIRAQHDRSMKANSRTILVLNSNAPTRSEASLVYFDTLIPHTVRVKQPLNKLAGMTSVAGYSNGLVCIMRAGEHLVVWNPSIRRFKQIPFEQPAGAGKRYYGFGYDSTDDDYKLVRVVVFGFDGVSSEVKIYSLKSNSWKKIQGLPRIEDFGMLSLRLSSWNGVLHWLMCHKLDEQTHRLVTLDLATERYDELPIPHYNDGPQLTLGVLGEEYLYVSLHYRPEAESILNSRNDVWIMKEYGVATSWTKLYTFALEDMPQTPEYKRLAFKSYRHCKPLLFSETGEKVLLHVDSDTLYWYDCETKETKRVHINGEPSCYSTAIWKGNFLLSDGDPV